MARARHKRTRSTDNTTHVSGMADRRAAYTFDIFLAYLHLSWPFLLLLFSSHPGLTGMYVSESNHGEQRAENPDPVDRLRFLGDCA